ncbi:MAG: hypothetical protein ABIC95_00155 [archaeon]
MVKLYGSRVVSKINTGVSAGSIDVTEYKALLNQVTSSITNVPPDEKKPQILGPLETAKTLLLKYDPAKDYKDSRKTTVISGVIVHTESSVETLVLDVGQQGHFNPGNVITRPHKDSYVNYDTHRFYFEGGIPTGWDGTYEVVGHAKTDNVHFAKAVAGEPSESTVNHKTLETKVKIYQEPEEKTVPVVSLHDVTPDKITVDDKITLVLRGGGPGSAPWQISLDPAKVSGGLTLGDIVLNPAAHTTGRAQADAAKLVTAEIESGNYILKAGAKRYQLSTPISELLQDGQEVYVERVPEPVPLNPKSIENTKPRKKEEQKQHRVKHVRVGSTIPPG